MVTIIIIILTAAVSLLCFYGGLDLDKLKFSAHDVWHRRKWWQLVTYGLVFPLLLRPDILQHFLHQLGI